MSNGKDFTFRFRFMRAPSNTINGDGHEWTYRDPISGCDLRLVSHQKEQSINKSESLVLKADGWATEADAQTAGKRCSDALVLALVKVRVGVDFGRRGAMFHYTEAGLEWERQRLGVERVIADHPGLLAYESLPIPLFVSRKMKGIRGVARESFDKAFQAALAAEAEINPNQRLAIELFGASFFQDAADIRFLLLVMAIETLLDPAPRGPQATIHVDELIELTRKNNKLSRDERASLIGTLNWMRRESIGRTGRQLAAKRLGKRIYADLKAPDFFMSCYQLRSALVHGTATNADREQVRGVVAQLEVFVSDLLSGPLLEV